MKSRDKCWMSGNRRRNWRVARLAACGLCMWLAAGCGGVSYEGVTGKVTLNGAPMTAGKLVFTSVKDGPTGYAQIAPDGTFTARTGSGEGLPAGDYKVAVIAEPGTNVPAAYADSLKTPLTIKVAEGENEPYDLPVK